MAGNTATISVAAFRCDWNTHMPMRALCERWTITRDQVIRLADVWKLPRRHDRRLRAKPTRQRDPTTTEIRMACLVIQSKWDERTRHERAVQKSGVAMPMRIATPDDVRDFVDDWNREAMQ
jgi:hypothetical protein